MDQKNERISLNRLFNKSGNYKFLVSVPYDSHIGGGMYQNKEDAIKHADRLRVHGHACEVLERVKTPDGFKNFKIY